MQLCGATHHGSHLLLRWLAPLPPLPPPDSSKHLSQVSHSIFSHVHGGAHHERHGIVDVRNRGRA